jgi:hypothetical protein
MASAHLAEYHVPGSTIPSKHYQSGLQLVQHGLRYIHAETKMSYPVIIIIIPPNSQ